MEVEGTIELPAEANPLTEGILFHVLRSAASNDPQQIQTGTKQLQKWETEKGFYSLLQTVFIDKSLPLEVRYLAIIQLKNGIDKYWRKTATNAVSKEEKAIIRSRLLESGVNEADQRLALQNALVIAKVIRFEFPMEWPDAITNVIAILRSSTLPNANRLHLPRALLILLHIVKELSTGRLRSKQASLQASTPEIFHVLGRVYVDKVQTWHSFLQVGGDDEGGALEAIEQSLLAIKVLRRLLIAGYEFPNREKDVQDFWALVRNQFGDFLSIVSQEPSPLSPDVRQLIEKHLLQLAKFHLDMAKTHPAAFVLLPDSLALVRAYWGMIAKFGETFGTKSATISGKIGADGDADEEERPIMERLSLKGLLLIRACVRMVFSWPQTFKYRKDLEKEEKSEAIELVKMNLLSDEWVREMLETVVTRFFVFRPSDLREWEEEPEEWERKEEGDGEGFEFSVRPCAEKLFMDLATNYKDIVIQPLFGVFYSVASPDNENILFKDSVYTAVGLAAPVLHQNLDFDTFITSTLVPEAQKQKPGYNILRRRIAILLGQWISVKVSEHNRAVVYEIFQHLLDKSDPLNDQVVRITAGRQFKNIADEWEFSAQQFLPYAPEILSRLMALVEEVELTETKMALLNTISVIVERLEHHITPYAERIVALLPPLWDQSGEEHLMKQAILTILARLINAMKAESRPFHPLVLPIIKGAVEPGSETQVYLLEDAMDLWSSIIVQTLAPASAELLSLAPYLLSIFELGSEDLRKALEIAQSYLLLAPSEMLADNFRHQLLAALTNLLGTLRPSATGIVTDLVEYIIRTAERIGGESAIEVLAGDLATTGFFGKLIEGLKEAWAAHHTVGPDRPTTNVDGIVETDYFSVLGRIGVASPRVLLQAIEAVTPGARLETTMKWLLEEWFAHLENIGDPPRRKLMCLALTRLLETGAPWILLKLQDLMTAWTDCIVELTDGSEDKSVDTLVWPAPEPATLPAGPEAPEDARRRDLIYSDPVHTTNLVACVREHLAAAVAAAGGHEAFQNEWLVNVDRDVVEGFGRLGVL